MARPSAVLSRAESMLVFRAPMLSRGKCPIPTPPPRAAAAMVIVRFRQRCPWVIIFPTASTKCFRALITFTYAFLPIALTSRLSEIRTTGKMYLIP